MNSITTSVESDVKFVVDLLFEGIIFGDKDFRAKCFRGIFALGDVAAEKLRVATNDISFSDQQRSWFRLVIQGMEETPFEGDIQLVISTALVDALRLKNRSIRKLAISSIRWCGPQIIESLINAAIDHIKSPDYCIRLLSAAKKCGYIPTIRTTFDLWIALAVTRNERIKGAILQLLESLKREPPDTLDDETMLAALNLMMQETTDGIASRNGKSLPSIGDGTGPFGP